MICVVQITLRRTSIVLCRTSVNTSMHSFTRMLVETTPTRQFPFSRTFCGKTKIVGREPHLSIPWSRDTSQVYWQFTPNGQIGRCRRAAQTTQTTSLTQRKVPPKQNARIPGTHAHKQGTPICRPPKIPSETSSQILTALWFATYDAK